jgi:aryl-alcohol dehydrogenase-like predicted oxidoreductase
MMRLCIGTVQFGMDYGVQGGTRPAARDAVAMLDYATQNGVDAIDTAAAYGTAEEVVGEFLSRKTLPREAVQVISKFGTNIFEGASVADYAVRLRAAAETSLKRIKSDYLDAYICHVPTAAGDPAIIEAMAALKASGLVRHVGFSVYDPDQVRACLMSDVVDFIQSPFSFLDRRMETSGVLAEARAKGIDFHTRSAFVQGLMLMDVAKIPEHLAVTRPVISDLEAACAEAGLSRRTLALAFVKANPNISHLVFGVDNLEQLKEIVSDFDRSVDLDAVKFLADRFAAVDPAIFLPNNWKT